MKVVITGGTGFLGQRLAARILEQGSVFAPSGGREAVSEMALFDSRVPPDLTVTDERIKLLEGDIADRATVAKLIDRPDIAVFHLASVVSAGAEQDFELAMRVNLDGHRYLLDALKALGSCPRYVFTSSLAVYGGDGNLREVDDPTRHIPQTTYGMTKAIGELLVNDYTRKGFIDGRSARLGFVIVRPGAPNRAASGFASGVLREPLNGEDYVCPVPFTTKVAATGYRTVIEGLLALHAVEGSKLGADRALNLRTRTVTVGEMIESLRRVARDRKLGAISEQPDPFVMKVISGWPEQMHATRAATLGFPQDESIDSIIREYISDYLK
ncbi:D-erythronate dehydrogenase [Peristeroidobacter agariperforans]|uniref:D-erythronate dehydrogenase n=1 Tax=Peristeroidobacter agariperforans TaxID=268404 RepID=UPI00101B9D9B|nr:D-erythronate dehydrogenase [Peristeroidobacter agariperforans]